MMRESMELNPKIEAGENMKSAYATADAALQKLEPYYRKRLSSIAQEGLLPYRYQAKDAMTTFFENYDKFPSFEKTATYSLWAADLEARAKKMDIDFVRKFVDKMTETPIETQTDFNFETAAEEDPELAPK